MSVRRSVVLLVVPLLLVCRVDAKDKKKQLLPGDVLMAETVLVVVHPEAGEPLNSPAANRIAREDVEQAIIQWGRFTLVSEPQNADLVIAVETGHAPGPTIKNSPADDQPIIYEPIDGGARVSVQTGRQPDLTDPGPGRPEPRTPHVGKEAGPAEDTFEVYRGGVRHPLDAPPVWRYMAKDALKGPQVDAVEQFRKLIAESEEQRREKQKKH